MSRAKRAKIILKILNKIYPKTQIPLKHKNAFTLLVSVALSASLPASYAVLIAPLKDQLFCQDWDTGRPRRSRCGDLLFRTFAVDDFDSGYLFFRIGVTVSPSGYLFFRCSRVVHWYREFVNSLTGRVLRAHNLINAGLA